MERPTMLFKALLGDLGRALGLSTERDFEVIRSRVEHEGLSFLTITLPMFCDAFELGIENGFVTREGWGNFSLPKRGYYPKFLQGFTTNVFGIDGRLLDDACADSIYAVRQICRFFKKLRIECTPDRNQVATQKFVDIEGELRGLTDQVLLKDEVLDEVSRIIWSQVFPEIDPSDIICRHGPGATAEKKRSNERFEITSWYHRSELTFPSDLHCIPNYGYFEALARVSYLDVSQERPVRVVFVPKTLKSPRVIAIEPSHVQYMQQGLMRYVVPILEKHPLTRRSIRFSDQQPNRDAARQASKDKRYATIDLSDASDRVHFELVRRIFKSSGILDYLEDSRSLFASLPDGREVILSKFASMGSAMCFPVEAMVFYTLIMSALHRQTGIRPSTKSVRNLSRYVHVYGDDIIVPVVWVDYVVSTLEFYGLRVNRRKSFVKSHFRESCGGDYFRGIPVNPVYAREVPYDDMTNWTPSSYMSWAETSDQLYKAGCWSATQLIRDWIESKLGVVPRATSEMGGLGFYSCCFTTNCRWDSTLQSFRQRRVHFQPKKLKDVIPTESAFFIKALIDEKGSFDPFAVGVVQDYESSVKRGVFKPKRRWFLVSGRSKIRPEFRK